MPVLCPCNWRPHAGKLLLWAPVPRRPSTHAASLRTSTAPAPRIGGWRARGGWPEPIPQER
eukprot:9111322-Pyramimonas_sp.AAC.1